MTEHPVMLVRRRAFKALKPPPRLPLAGWIESNVHLPDTVSALVGKVTLWEFQRGICEAIDNSDIERVTLIKPVRVGFTTLLTSTIGSYCANAPAPMLAVLPTEADCRDYMVSDIEPIFAASPTLRGILSDDTEDSGRNTLLSRRFAGGSLKIVAAKSQRNLRRHTAKILLLDEIDGMEPGPEGDPITLAERRTLTYRDRKIIEGSTPVFDHGPVSRQYALSDQRIFEVPCPECGEFNEIMWSHIVRPEGEPERAHYVCPHNGCVVEERHKVSMVAAGRWRITAPQVKGHAGFRLNALVSPHAHASWGKLAAEFLKAKNSPDTLQTFVNTLLGQAWKTEGDELDETGLASRREAFGLAAIQPDVLLITVGADAQDDRLECVVVGHGRDTTYVLAHRVLWGPIDDGAVWTELEDLLRSSWAHPNGGTLRVDAAVIDSSDGDHQPHVQAFTRSGFGRRIVSGKGAAGWTRPPIQRSKTAEGLPFFVVGVDALKQSLFNRLSHGNSVRFSQDLEPIYFEQLTSERRVVRYVKGAPVRRFERIPGKRAETLDATVYGLAARQLLNMSLDQREADLASPAAPAARVPTVIKSAWLEGN